jgi:hypothetical protein
MQVQRQLPKLARLQVSGPARCGYDGEQASWPLAHPALTLSTPSCHPRTTCAPPSYWTGNYSMFVEARANTYAAKAAKLGALEKQKKHMEASIMVGRGLICSAAAWGPGG